MPNINSNLLPNHGTGNSGVGMIEVGKKSKALRVSMKRLYDMFVLSGFLKMNFECHLERGDYYEIHGREGHHIEDCIKFHKKVAKMFTIKELRIEAIKGNHEVRMMEGQERLLEVRKQRRS